MSDEERRLPASDGQRGAVPADFGDAATRVVGTDDDPAARATRVLEEAAVSAPRETRVLTASDELDVARAATVVSATASGGAAAGSVSDPTDGAGIGPTETPAQPPESESSDVEGLAPTRVLEEDKTSPPPVAPPVASPPRAAPAQAPRPASAPKPREEDRGLRPGTILFGEYEIVSVLGAGGMGEVYRARHRRLDEHRAIKVMHAEMSKRRGASEFFYREAKALLAVRHPAVVHCHDLLSDDAGRVYLIMEMIEGIPLSKKLNEGPLSPDDVAVLGARVAHGLAAAHRKGVIHRDLSPDNIVLPGGRVQEAKIIDFGIAKLLEQGEGTIVDGFKGKLSYASPEQLGFFGGKIDGRSDLYSLGLVLAAAALGRPMTMGTSVMEAVDARRNLKGLPDGIPMGLRSAIQPLLALNPEDRPKYVDRLFVVPGALESSESGLYPTPGSKSARPARPNRPVAAASAAGNRTGLLLATGGAGALLVAGLVYFGATIGGPSDPGPAAPATNPTGSVATDATTGAPTADGGLAPSPSGAGGITADAAGVAVDAATAGDTAAANAGGATAPSEGALAATAAGATNRDTANPEANARPTAKPSPTASAAADSKSSTTVARVAPAPTKRSGPSASERIKIVGLLTGAKVALGEGNLMSPPGDNAYDKYRSVLNLDPRNTAARSGLRDIATRYVKRANDAIEKGDTAAAREHLRRARQADASLPTIRTTEARLSGS